MRVVLSGMRRRGVRCSGWWVRAGDDGVSLSLSRARALSRTLSVYLALKVCIYLSLFVYLSRFLSLSLVLSLSLSHSLCMRGAGRTPGPLCRDQVRAARGRQQARHGRVRLRNLYGRHQHDYYAQYVRGEKTGVLLYLLQVARLGCASSDILNMSSDILNMFRSSTHISRSLTP